MEKPIDYSELFKVMPTSSLINPEKLLKLKPMKYKEYKYYVPNIEDFYLGYEYEEYIPGTDDQYKKRVYDLNDAFIVSCYRQYLESAWVRTQSLTKEQIEAEGWEWKETYKCYHKKFVISDTITHWIDIRIIDGIMKVEKTIRTDISESTGIPYASHFSSSMIFEGSCPSINEFRKIIKLLYL